MHTCTQYDYGNVQRLANQQKTVYTKRLIASGSMNTQYQSGLIVDAESVFGDGPLEPAEASSLGSRSVSMRYENR